MAWEERSGRRYYYRSIREGERVRKEYIGAGEFVETLARSDEAIRLVRKLERDGDRQELERMKALGVPVLEIGEAAAVLARAHLVSKGFHRRKGEWRRVRNT